MTEFERLLAAYRSGRLDLEALQADGVAAGVLRQAEAGRELIIISPNPLTWLLMPLTCWGRERYYRWFTQRPDP